MLDPSSHEAESTDHAPVPGVGLRAETVCLGTGRCTLRRREVRISEKILYLEDPGESGESIGEESVVVAVLVDGSQHAWICESLDG